MAHSYERSEEILNLQKAELDDVSFKKQCFFCKIVFEGSLQNFVDHLNLEHNFRIGPLENMVYVQELLQSVQSKLDSHVCLFCDEEFSNDDDLRQHMKSMQHRQLPLEDIAYDKYFVRTDINKANAESGNGSDSSESSEDEAGAAQDYCKVSDQLEDWEDWQVRKGDSEDSILCLFCNDRSTDVENLSGHMRDVHGFGWNIIERLPFYEKVKLINYIRKCTHDSICMYCQEPMETKANLLRHFASEKLSTLPEKKLWDSDKFYSSIFENDALLWFLQDNDSDNDCGSIVTTE